MTGLATLSKENTIELPSEIAEHFAPLDRFVIWIDGDTVHLKRIMPSPLQIVENASADDELTLDEIDDIVHEVRRNRPESQVN